MTRQCQTFTDAWLEIGAGLMYEALAIVVSLIVAVIGLWLLQERS